MRIGKLGEMHPLTHFSVGWLVADSDGLDRRDRAIVTIAGVIADLDGIGIVAELATRNTQTPLLWWSKYHHLMGHNLAFGLVCTATAFALAKKRARTAALAFLGFHIHLLCDLAGARGPDGDQWPIPYLIPFSEALQLSWKGQWALNAWPNFLITGVALALVFFLAWKRGYSPLEMISRRADEGFVGVLRNLFPRSQANEPH